MSFLLDCVVYIKNNIKTLIKEIRADLLVHSFLYTLSIQGTNDTKSIKPQFFSF